MISLAKLQNEMQNAILGRNNTLSKHIKTTVSLSPQQRLYIYCQAYSQRLIVSLSEDFPALLFCLGKDVFAAMVSDLAKSHPSKEFSLDALGLNLKTMLQDIECIEPYYVELIEFEWALKQALLAPNQDFLQLDDFENLTEECSLTTRFNLTLSVKLFTTNYDIVKAYEKILAGDKLISFNHHKDAKKYLLWRHLFSTYYIELNDKQLKLFSLLEKSMNLVEITDKFMQSMSGAEIAQWLPLQMKLWIDRGLFARRDAVV